MGIAFLTQAEFEQALAEYLRAGATPETAELAETLQMELASPGDWEAAKHQDPDLPGTPE